MVARTALQVAMDESNTVIQSIAMAVTIHLVFWLHAPGAPRESSLRFEGMELSSTQMDLVCQFCKDSRVTLRSWGIYTAALYSKPFKYQPLQRQRTPSFSLSCQPKYPPRNHSAICEGRHPPLSLSCTNLPVRGSRFNRFNRMVKSHAKTTPELTFGNHLFPSIGSGHYN